MIWSCGPSRSWVRLNLIASSVTAPSPTQFPLREALFLHTATMPISHVDVPAVRFRSPASAAAAASRLIRSWDAAHWTIGRRCQDSARQRPRKEIKCLNSLALRSPFSVFSLCSEFTYQETHKYCSRFDLLTHALNVCHSFPAWLPGAQQLVVTLRSSKTDSFRLGHSLIIARTGSQVCAVTAMQHYFQLVAPSSGPYFLFPVRPPPYQVSGHFPLTGYRASCRASFS